MKKMFNILLCVSCGFAAALTTAACSEDSYGPDPDRSWATTTTAFASTDDAAFLTYYKPAIGRVGDPMPFYDQKAGEFKVLYLQEYDNNGACYHPFWGLATKDGATYQPLGEVLPTGTSTAQQDAAHDKIRGAEQGHTDVADQKQHQQGDGVAHDPTHIGPAAPGLEPTGESDVEADVIANQRHTQPDHDFGNG